MIIHVLCNIVATGNQLIGFNIIKAEPVERIPLFGSSGANTSNLNLQPISSFSQPHISIQTLRPQMSPGRTPSPMDYNPPLVQQPYQPNNVTPIMQQSNILDVQFYNESQLSENNRIIEIATIKYSALGSMASAPICLKVLERHHRTRDHTAYLTDHGGRSEADSDGDDGGGSVMMMVVVVIVVVWWWWWWWW
ncbi:hypothetical protein ALC60_13427 [Trachymyrmex zeteki]|uniref:Uncharacterized protein n=1 Tax=Mycetomoellerius zeteki TaxID=64791 RepID=A0A151WIN2_9HYME|nr:hypothetical protein ALC60_13427 [Trachymyrmex zeteki]